MKALPVDEGKSDSFRFQDSKNNVPKNLFLGEQCKLADVGPSVKSSNDLELPLSCDLWLNKLHGPIRKTQIREAGADTRRQCPL